MAKGELLRMLQKNLRFLLDLTGDAQRRVSLSIGPSFIKQLMRRVPDGVFLRQFKPPRELPKIAMARIKHIYRVPRPDELLSD